MHPNTIAQLSLTLPSDSSLAPLGTQSAFIIKGTHDDSFKDPSRSDPTFKELPRPLAKMMLGQGRPKVDWYRKTDDIDTVLGELDGAEDGSFLVLRGSKPQHFRVLVRFNDATDLFVVKDEGVGIGVHFVQSNQMFANLADLIEFYQTPASLSSQDLPCLLMDARSYQVAYNSVGCQGKGSKHALLTQTVHRRETFMLWCAKTSLL